MIENGVFVRIPLIRRFLVVLFGLVVFAASPAAAQTTPRTILLLFDGLALDDLKDRGSPRLSALAQSGQIALMNTANGGGPRDQAAILPLVLGTLAPAESTDTDVYPADFAPIENGTAGVVFQRRTGIVVNPKVPNSVVHLGIASLARRGLNSRTMGAVLSVAGKGQPLIAGGLDTYRTGLFTVDAQGVGPAGFFTRGRTPEDIRNLAQWAVSEPRSVVIDLNSSVKSELETFLTELSEKSGGIPYRLLLISPISAESNRLSIVLLNGSGVAPGLLTSATTRTPGLIANIDIAPTLLAWLGVPAPASMTGHTLQLEPQDDAISHLERTDRLVSVNARGLVPVGILLALLTGISLVGGLLSLKVAPQFSRWFGFVTLALLNIPLALMLVSLLNPASAALLALEAALLMLLGTGLETIFARLLRFSPCVIATGLTVLVVLADAIVSGSLVKFSLLSGYQIQGIRFYGIGNEYMGVLIGFTLLAAYLKEMKTAVAVTLFLVVTAILGTPQLGAKAGGIVTAITSFGLAYGELRGKRPGFRSFVKWSILGFTAAFGVAALERMAGPNTSHLGGALKASNELGYGYLLEIVVRKLQMNARIFLHPAALTAIAFTAGTMALSQSALKRQAERLARVHSGWCRGLSVAGWGALAAFIYNDSGTVAALYLVGSFLLSGLYLLLVDNEKLPYTPDVTSSPVPTVEPHPDPA